MKSTVTPRFWIPVVLVVIQGLSGMTNSLKAQEYLTPFQRLSTQDGLSSNLVQCMLQDQRGFMWIGTREGLNRYDGKDFKVYRYEAKNPNSLSHNHIRLLYEDSQGNIWVGTAQGGVNRLNPFTEEITRFLPDNPSSYQTPSFIQEDEQGHIWILFRKGLVYIQPHTKKIMSYTHPLWKGKKLVKMAKDEKNKLLLILYKMITTFSSTYYGLVYVFHEPYVLYNTVTFRLSQAE